MPEVIFGRPNSIFLHYLLQPDQRVCVLIAVLSVLALADERDNVFIAYQKDVVEDYWPRFLNLSSVCQHEITVLKGNLLTENPTVFEITLLFMSPCFFF